MCKYKYTYMLSQKRKNQPHFIGEIKAYIYGLLIAPMNTRPNF